MKLDTQIKLVASECKNLTNKNMFIPDCDIDSAQLLLNEIHLLVSNRKPRGSSIATSFYQSCVYHIADFGILTRYEYVLHLYAFNKMFHENYYENMFLINVEIAAWCRPNKSR